MSVAETELRFNTLRKYKRLDAFLQIKST